MPTLEVYKGKKQIGSFILKDDIITIGRSGNNDIVLPDDKLKVSRYHSVLLRIPDNSDRYIIRDLSSSRGTKVGKQYIFQKVLNVGDIIHIVDFHLKYTTPSEKEWVPFRITDEDPNSFSLSFPSDVGVQSTRVRRLEEIVGSFIPELPKEIKMMLEEFLYRMDSAFTAEGVLNSAIELLFNVLNMKKGCFGCFALFEGDDSLKFMAGRGMESRASIHMPRQVIEKLKSGQSFIMENHLWIPLLKDKHVSSGFLYLCRGPYAPHFQEDEVKITSFICQIVANAFVGKEDKVISQEEIIKWPKDMISNEQILREIKTVAKLNENVLILGETGVGKEVAADEIHRQSARKEKVIRKVNCAAIPKDLVESELFGHKKGAFTGATEDKKGEFELADGSTIFLDEIADLPWESQRKLLRVIQEKSIKRLGEEKEKNVNVKIIGATNRDIQKDMEGGRFGSDLYYRFGERILIPPLRERKRDIPLLAHYFLDKFVEERSMQLRGITPQAMKCLLSYPWPGNIRELKDCVGNALSKSEGVIFIQHLPDEIRRYRKTDIEKTVEKSKPKSLDDIEKEKIKETLQYTRGNKEKAIKILKIAKQTLYNKMEKYKIPADFGKG